MKKLLSMLLALSLTLSFVFSLTACNVSGDDDDDDDGDDACVHVDKDDDGECDKCDEAFEDGCDAEHRDADDDGKCDFGGEDFEDGCSRNHVDTDGNYVCDRCGDELEQPKESSKGLEFELNEDGESYTLIGIGNCTESNIVIDTYNGKPVTAIGESAFEDCDSLTSVTIGSSVESIASCAFLSCHGLSGVSIGNSVKDIGEGAFEDCINLTSIIIPDSVESIGDGAFYNCSELINLTIGSGVYIIRDSAFAHCDSLVSVFIPINVTSVDDSIFSNCDSLKTIYCEAECLPDGWDDDWDYGFDGNIFWGYRSDHIHRDADDNGKCDTKNCLATFYDWCDTNDCEDYNDDSVCDICEYCCNDGCNFHIDSDGNGKCDYCDKELLDADDWKAAFDFANVTAELTRTVSYTEDGETKTQVIDNSKNLFIQGTVFMSMEYQGEKMWEVQNDSGFIPLIDFSTHFAKFTEANEKFTAESIDLVIGEDDYSIPVRNIVITFTDGKLATIAYSVFVDWTNSYNYSFSFKDYGKTEIPAGAAMSYYSYEDADIDDLVVIESYVQATQSWWNNTIIVYLQDYSGAYFAYEMACSEKDAAKLTPGTKIRIVGTKAEWCGEVEIVDATFTFVENSDTYIANATDVTYLLGTENLVDYQNRLVSFTDMTVKAIEYKNGEPGDDIYVTLTKNGVDYSFCVEVYLTGADTEVYTAVGELTAGDVIDVEGFLYWYNGMCPHITAVTKK